MANAVTSIAENNSIGFEVIWKPLLADPKINALPFNIHFGKIGREFYFDQEFTAAPSLKTDCGWNFKTGTPITKKALDPYELDFSFEQCYTPFVKSVWGDQLPDGASKGELFPEIIDRIVTKQSNAFNTNLLYATFLASQGNGTAWLAGGDGVFAKLLAGVAANDGTVDAGAITDTDILPANIEATMFRIYTAQSALMESYPDTDKVLLVTNSIAKAWKRYLQTQTGLNTIIQTEYITRGVNELSYNNIPMVVMDWVDRGIALYDTTGSPASTVNPNRAILTTTANHHIMIDGTGFENIDPFYDRKDDKVYSPASAMVDYLYAYGEFNVIAGF